MARVGGQEVSVIESEIKKSIGYYYLTNTFVSLIEYSNTINVYYNITISIKTNN